MTYKIRTIARNGLQQSKIKDLDMEGLKSLHAEVAPLVL